MQTLRYAVRLDLFNIYSAISLQLVHKRLRLVNWNQRYNFKLNATGLEILRPKI